MLNVLLTEIEPGTLEVLRLYFESRHGFFVLEAPTEIDCQDLIAQNQQIDFIFYSKQSPKTIFKKSFCLPQEFTFDVFDSFVSKVMSEQKVVLKEGHRFDSGEEIFSVSIRDFMKYNRQGMDVYLKMAEQKFTKIFSKNQDVTKDDLVKYFEKGVTAVYLSRQDFRSFIDQLFVILAPKRLKEDELPPTSALAIKYVHQAIQLLGVSATDITMINEYVEEYYLFLKKQKSIATFMDSFLVTKDYSVAHALLTMYLTSALILDLNWNSKATFKKIAYASFLHDAFIPSKEVARISDLNSSEYKLLSNEYQKIVREHPRMAAELINNLEAFFNDSAIIMMEHHEKPDGSGFPRGLTAATISPLSCVFILAHNFIDLVFENGTILIENIPHAIDQMRKEYSKGNFKKPFESLQKITTVS